MSQKRGREEEDGPTEEDENNKRVLSLPKRSRELSGVSSLKEAKAIPQHSLTGALDKVDDSGGVPSTERGGYDENEDDDYSSSSGTSTTYSDDEDSNEEEEHDDNLEEKEQSDDDDIKREGLQNPKDDNENEDAITYVPGRPKPKIQRIERIDNSNLLSKISSFLPQLQAANADLERKLASGEALDDMILDDAKEGEEGQYIEMNLGLGVLKEKKKKRKALEAESTSESDDEDKDNPEDAEDQDEGHVMDQLMGMKKRSQKTKPGIQEVDDNG